MTNSRYLKLSSFVKGNLQKAKLTSPFELVALSGDASFRKYYKLKGLNLIAVDSPPDTQKNNEFIQIARALSLSNLIVPKVFSYDLEQGFMLISDLGDISFDKVACGQEQRFYYQRAVDLLPLVAKTSFSTDFSLPRFSREFIFTELKLFEEWMLNKFLKVELNPEEKQVLNQTYELLAVNCLEQKQVAMHRDFHCRNLMVVPQKELAVIDFQDMVQGPISYDLASILFDCYIRLDDNLILELERRAFESFKNNLLIDKDASFEDFDKSLRLTSLQRHIKVLGIFCRLSLRDGKDNYLKDLPRVISYVKEECKQDDRLLDFAKIINKYVEGKF